MSALKRIVSADPRNVALALVATATALVVWRAGPGLADLAVLIWLLPLALYDMRAREVPHIAFAAVPCLVAGVAAVLRGDWTLAALSAVAVAASERRCLPKGLRVVAVSAAAGAAGVLILLTPLEQVWVGALCVVCFWLAYELGWWAGADALIAMTLAMLYPDARFVAALGAAMLAVVIAYGRLGKMMRMGLPRRLSESDLDAVGTPGLPALAMAALTFIMWKTLA